MQCTMQLIAVKRLPQGICGVRSDRTGVLDMLSDVQYGKRKRSDIPLDARRGCLCWGNSLKSMIWE